MEARLPGTLWQRATVVDVRSETPRAKTLRLRTAPAPPPVAGQHLVVRLTAPDGYTAMRSYSIASAPEDAPDLDITVERLDDGEVSTYLHDVVEVGDELEVRGPLGRWFVWDGTAPALLVGGGSGIVPLMAMLRHARRTGRGELVRLVASVRSSDDLYYPEELPGPETRVIYTRTAPSGAGRAAGRLTVADLAPAPPSGTTGYVCGSTSFTNAATDLLVSIGMPVSDIRVSRFGPSG